MIADGKARGMRIRSGLEFAVPLAACMLLVSCATGGAGNGGDGYEPERHAWGAPVIDGTWDYRTLTPIERPPEFGDKAMFTPEEAEAFRAGKVNALDSDNRASKAQQDLDGAYNAFWLDYGTDLGGELRTSLIVDPPNGRLPELTPTARAAMEAQMRERTIPVREISSGGDTAPQGPEWLGTAERCLVGPGTGPPMLPTAYNNNVRIVQTQDYVLLVTEMIHEPRIIPFEGRPRVSSAVPSWAGDGRAHWEGNTLVIETRNFTDKTPTFKMPVNAIQNFSYEGSVGSAKNLRLTERITPIAEGRLLYEFTIDDPKTFVRPFTVQLPMKPTEGPMFEYACHEGNYALRNTLEGTRFLESKGK